MRSCRWILRPATPEKEAEYCDCPVKYSIETDDDGQRRRKYETFCPRHKELLSKQEDSDD